MQRRQFTQSLVAASTGLLWATSSRAVGLQDPMDSKTVSVGCSLGTTGPLASLARELKQGLDAGLAQANARGIHGREIKLVTMDDGYDAKRSEENVRKMIADANTVALISCMGTANNQRIMPLVDEAQIPYVAPQSGAVSLRKAEYRSVFHVRASYSDEAQRLTQKTGVHGHHRSGHRVPGHRVRPRVSGRCHYRPQGHRQGCCSQGLQARC